MFVEIVPMTIQMKICVAFMINYDDSEEDDLEEDEFKPNFFLDRDDLGPQDFERFILLSFLRVCFF